MPSKIAVRTDDRGFRQVIIENELLVAELFPELGARIFNLTYKPADYQLLWHHPTVPLDRVPVGASYDDNFAGGWEELFPNDAPANFQGRDLPDHGELWCQAWDFEVQRAEGDEVALYLRRENAITPTYMEKWITLRAGESILRFRHRITNRGSSGVDFLWKLHPALRASAAHRVDVPGRRAEFVGPDWSRLPNAPREFDWPVVHNASGEAADLSRVLPIAANLRDFVYVKDLKEGWCALTDTERRVGFGLVFPREVFRWVWLFMPAGGWRGLHMVILEPCTTCPKDLHAAARAGHCAHLEPGGVLECSTLGVVYAGLARVSTIDGAGRVSGS